MRFHWPYGIINDRYEYGSHRLETDAAVGESSGFAYCECFPLNTVNNLNARNDFNVGVCHLIRQTLRMAKANSNGTLTDAISILYRLYPNHISDVLYFVDHVTTWTNEHQLSNNRVLFSGVMSASGTHVIYICIYVM